MVLAKLRSTLKIIGKVKLVKKVLQDCVHCQKQHGRVINQIMADLPNDHLESDKPSFHNTGPDLFGPFKVVRGRGSVDRYGLIFTCLSSRAVHLEAVFDKSTDSFIQALHRFIARWGQVWLIRSDNGTNFVGAERELKKVLEDLDHKVVSKELGIKNIKWIFNPPLAFDFGRAWEQEIRRVRGILSGILCEQPRSLSDKSLNTLLCEVEAIMNSRSLTPSSDDPSDLEAITPNHLILQNAVATFPPGLFIKDKIYARHRWKQMQYLADLLWI
ncbi:uncharacterized protein LOC131881532 [Tigriopus californicus]|uniref:uncharacterized protein LOC131881532 n=1 Tax=Tigriopus californicus TaxID=6832 RepID=UPI0027DA60E3|nr:uncharacterized protein LOC131881532 [Tigriopus californicus]